ncbi:CBS domain-containing protein [Pyxidicoccus trucidator]|uniref:CBS domain-containing protein n=1 Tax=Pyxidicoccus trucidator TaxID=2709662 RepID=UPI0013DB735E|nr:CBS domain-containing protein [Pyxidicoccus trucidator]
MARTLDNGKDDTRNAQRNPPPEPGTYRSPDVAPPGSRERGESDLTGWNPARDEEASARQGRFHRAASLRMAQPRTNVDDGAGFGTQRTGMMNMDDRDAAWEGAEYGTGPYGRDNRDGRSATGRGDRRDMGMQENELPPQRADYRPWNRHGYGGEEPRETQGPRTEPYRDEHSRSHYREERQRTEERQRMGDRMREDRSQFYTASPSGRPSTGTGTDTGTGRRRWQREPLTAREVMTRSVRTARLDSPVRDVAQIMKDEDCGVVPIVNERGSLVGIVTDRDLVVRGFTGGKSPEQLRVSDVMTDDVEAVLPDENIHDVIALMGRKQIRRIPVVERDDRVVGIISMGDIANRADYDEELQEALDRVSSKRSFWSRLS